MLSPRSRAPPYELADRSTPTRAAKPEVNAVLRRLRSLGLRLEFSRSSSHWRVIDPGTGAYLTSISNTPSDTNWWRHVQRAVERAGFSWEGGKRKKIRATRFGGAVAGVDLEALARAQHLARIHGQREPQLEDLDDTKFRDRIRRGYNEQETEEAIDHMAQGVDSARAHRVVSRLLYVVEQRGEELAARARERNPKYGDGAIAQELIHMAEQVSKKRGLRFWKNKESAMQTFRSLLSGTSAGMTVWTANLLEATMDELDGLRWDAGTTEPATTPEPPPAETKPSLALSAAEAQRVLLQSLSEEWVDRRNLHDSLVPGIMSEGAFGKSATELSKAGLLERQKQAGGAMLYRKATGIPVLPEPEPPEPEPMPEPEPAPAPEPEPEYAEVAVPIFDSTATIADRYANVLLEAVRTQIANGQVDWQGMEPILARLDALAGVGKAE